MRLCMFMYVYVNHVQSSAVDLLVLRVLFSKWLVEDHLKVLKTRFGGWFWSSNSLHGSGF